MSSIPLIDSSSPLLLVDGTVVGLDSGTFGAVLSRGSGGRSSGPPVGAGPPFGFGYRFRSSSRRRRTISSGSGSPNGPVFRAEPDVGTPSPSGKVGAVVPLGGGCLITLIVGNDGVLCPDCSRASASVVARVSYRMG